MKSIKKERKKSVLHTLTVILVLSLIVVVEVVVLNPKIIQM